MATDRLTVEPGVLPAFSAFTGEICGVAMVGSFYLVGVRAEQEADQRNPNRHDTGNPSTFLLGRSTWTNPTYCHD